MIDAFVQTPTKTKIATICFIKAKLIFGLALVLLLASEKTAAIISVGLYAVLVWAAIILSGIDFYNQRKVEDGI
jgi:hypothetical protein